jgi:hypothetical protein
MSKHHHEHEHSHHHPSARKGLHPRWYVVIAVVLMLVAILSYVLTNDDAVVPQPAQPTAPAPVDAGR